MPGEKIPGLRCHRHALGAILKPGAYEYTPIGLGAKILSDYGDPISADWCRVKTKGTACVEPIFYHPLRQWRSEWKIGLFQRGEEIPTCIPGYARAQGVERFVRPVVKHRKGSFHTLEGDDLVAIARQDFAGR